MKILCALLFSILAFTAQAELLQIPAAGGGSTVPVYWEKVEGATATVILLPGGDGVVRFAGEGKGNRPKGNNFLVRSYGLFAAAKMNVAVMGTNLPNGLSFEERASDGHLADLKAIADVARTRSPNTPVWLVGTSRGTVSAVLAAIKYAGTPAFDGVVLTSALVSWQKPYAIGRQKIEKITIPTLVYMHAEDACQWCQLHEAKGLIGKFKNAPVQAFMAVRGGSPDVNGDPCHGSHNHGFMGMEEKAVADITAWINNPVAIAN